MEGSKNQIQAPEFASNDAVHGPSAGHFHSGKEEAPQKAGRGYQRWKSDQSDQGVSFRKVIRMEIFRARSYFFTC